jgi:hypothetical protein
VTVPIYQLAIIADVLTAYNNARNNAGDDERAVAAARECFEGIADKICDHATSEEWESCEHCN